MPWIPARDRDRASRSLRRWRAAQENHNWRRLLQSLSSTSQIPVFHKTLPQKPKNIFLEVKSLLISSTHLEETRGRQTQELQQNHSPHPNLRDLLEFQPRSFTENPKYKFIPHFYRDMWIFPNIQFWPNKKWSQTGPGERYLTPKSLDKKILKAFQQIPTKLMDQKSQK